MEECAIEELFLDDGIIPRPLGHVTYFTSATKMAYLINKAVLLEHFMTGRNVNMQIKLIVPLVSIIILLFLVFIETGRSIVFYYRSLLYNLVLILASAPHF